MAGSVRGDRLVWKPPSSRTDRPSSTQRASAVQVEEIAESTVDGGSPGHRDARRGGRPAELYGASDDGNAAGTGVPRPPDAAGDGGVLRDRRVSRRGVDQGKEERDGLAGLRDECRGDDAGSGGVGVPGPVSDRGRLVALKGSVTGTDAAVLAGRGTNPRAGISAELGVACADPARMGGAPTIAAGGNEVAGGLCRSTGPPDGASQRGVAAGGDEGNQRECGRGQRTDARHVVAVDRGADTPPRTLGSTT